MRMALSFCHWHCFAARNRASASSPSHAGRWALGDRYYAICLDPSRRHGQVVVVGDSLQVIAESFAEFAKMYVEDSMSLYGGGPVVDASDL